MLSQNNLKIVSISEIPKIAYSPLEKHSVLEIYSICLKLEELCKKENGVGLNAMQCGIPWTLFTIRINGKYRFYLDCSYEKNGDKINSAEGCLSIKRNGVLRFFRVDRYSSIKLFGKQIVEHDEPCILEVNEVVSHSDAIVFQHEIDHSSNPPVLISQIGEEIFPT